MSNKKFKRNRDDNYGYEDEYPKQKLSKVKEEKNRKKQRNFGNALRSKDISKLMDYDDD